jgi:hypothetical protein
MEQVALPVEGPERQVVEGLLTKGKKARAAMPEAKVRALVPDLGDQVPRLLEGLAARGLVETSQTRGKVVYALSPSGVAALKAATATPRAARTAKPKAITIEEVQALLRELEARLTDRIRAEVVGAVREALGETPKAAQPAVAKTEPLEAAIPGAIKEADRHGHHGGLVPIPEVRRLVQQRTGATRAQFDAALLALERQFRVDLKIANDARRPDAAEGIEVPGRGLVYFALAR